MDQRIIDLYDQFTHGGMNRRQFLDRLADIAGSSAAAVALLPLLQNDYARAAVIAPDDARLAIDTVSYDADGQTISGQLARHKTKAKRPAVIVIHQMIGTLDAAATARRIAAAVPFLATHAESNGNVGAVGFCWGGGMVNRIAVIAPDLKAGVAYYGAQAPADAVTSIRAALLLQYAGLDQRINAGIPAYEAALKAAGKDFTVHIYPDVNHAFNNDTGNRYDKAAADLAWGRTLAFFKQHLGAPPA